MPNELADFALGERMLDALSSEPISSSTIEASVLAGAMDAKSAAKVPKF